MAICEQLKLSEMDLRTEVAVATIRVAEEKKTTPGSVQQEILLVNLVNLLSNTPGAVEEFIDQQSKLRK
ncbi:MAG: hypothetical protein Q7R53_00780 [bacterium]|nr:hypothetical protein [bacterium]